MLPRASAVELIGFAKSSIELLPPSQEAFGRARQMVQGRRKSSSLSYFQTVRASWQDTHCPMCQLPSPTASVAFTRRTTLAAHLQPSRPQSLRSMGWAASWVQDSHTLSALPRIVLSAPCLTLERQSPRFQRRRTDRSREALASPHVLSSHPRILRKRRYLVEGLSRKGRRRVSSCRRNSRR
jgi:hypothetical protein